MVQVGYNYYSQCYELKKKKQGDMLPGMKVPLRGVKSNANIDSVSGRPDASSGIYMNNRI